METEVIVLVMFLIANSYFAITGYKKGDHLQSMFSSFCAGFVAFALLASIFH